MTFCIVIFTSKVKILMQPEKVELERKLAPKYNGVFGFQISSRNRMNFILFRSIPAFGCTKTIRMGIPFH